MSLFYFYVKSLKQVILFTLLILLTFNGWALIHPKQYEANQSITKLYEELNKAKSASMEKRLDMISSFFVGKEYILGALGEGINARFDQEPRYRVDAFDCDTYVTTVLALALAQNTDEFKQCLSNIRYKNGKVSYVTRNHFTSIDWNKNNQDQGYLQDITESIKDKSQHPAFKLSITLIDKPSWFNYLTLKNIRLIKTNPTTQSDRLAELKQRGENLPKVISKLPYIPLTTLFDKQGKPNLFLFSQIPNASIIEIVRPNWSLQNVIGTNLDISHLGFTFWKNGVLFFRQASSIEGHVVEISLIDYLKEALLNPTIKGINIQVIQPKVPFEKNCTN